ncbi:cupin [Seonamhaeicola sp. ML3]|uniref:cupin n=1 Tax=Seonamhaeicola sp. ML3 TaxID=2937786 RepID=UPI00200D787F|nr:cupin [Seonamhaeicola sp. ML3]
MSKLIQDISIVGLGWLGLPLYTELTQLGYSCIGTTTSKAKQTALEKDHISAFYLELLEDETLGEIQESLNSKLLILNKPPGLRKNPQSNYISKIENFISHIEQSAIEKMLFISSTSVFKDEDTFPEVFNHTTPNSETNAGLQISNVEKLLQENTKFKTTILRFSGLVNSERHPARMMSKRLQVKNPNAPVNLIHQKDCIGLISKLITRNIWGETYNASFPSHISKKEYYDSVCHQFNISKPNFDMDSPSRGKRINGVETSKVLNYKYEYPI